MRVGRIDGEPGTFRVKLIPRDIANKALVQRTTSAHFPLQFLCKKKKKEMTAINGEGKDRVIFVTKEEHEIPSTVKLVEEDTNEDHEVKGLILPSGEINWDCPCLGGMASGACGEQFKTLFTCFHFSQEEVKGSDCLEQFRSVQKCFRQHPELFPKKDDLQSGNPGSDTEQKDPPSISDLSTSKESDPLPTETNDMPSQQPIAS
uniref:Coiled-coil-helix-coiled-coil-helix domain containing 4b n=1 Tax=Cyprinus carpio TaxID=7962 RepID=A0A8C2AXH3_CYPCA